MQFITAQDKKSTIVSINPDLNEELHEPSRVPYRASEDDDDTIPSPGDDEEESQTEEAWGDRHE